MFDPLTIPLPGVHSIAASAGTGKTYTIATLYLRYLLETDCVVDQVLVATYTEAATAELKDRLRGRLQEASQVLRHCCDLPSARRFVDDDKADPVVVGVLEQAGAWSPDTKRLVANRLDTAILDFDHAPISTIHGFCNRVLQELVFETGGRFDVELVTTQTPMIEEPVSDFASQWWTGSDPAMSRWLRLDDSMWCAMHRIATLVVDHPGCPVVPDHGDLEQHLASPLLDEFESEIQKLAELWNDSGKQAHELVIAARDKGWLNKSKYGRPKQIPDAIEFIDQLVRSRSPDQFQFDSNGTVKAWQRRLSQRELIRGTKKDHKGEAPRHEVFHQIDAVVDSATRIKDHRELIRARMFARLSQAVRNRVRQRQEEDGLLGFSDLLHRVDEALAGPQRDLLRRGLRSRFRVAMVDEFQDTDPVQYRIFRRAFQEETATVDGHECRAFVMIGDPKQSIYHFRGADIHSYLRATEQTSASNRYTMGTNWRSDRSLVNAVQAIFASVDNPFMAEGICLPPIQAHYEDRMDGGSAFEIGFLGRGSQFNETKALPQSEALKRIARQVAADIVTQMQEGPRIQIGVDDVKRPVTPGDFAVLCRTGKQLRDIQKELSKRDVPAVLQTNESIFDTSEAVAVTHVLRAMLNPGHRSLMVNALLCPIFGFDAEALERIRQDEQEFATWVRRMRDWHDLWRKRGFIVAWRRLLVDEDVFARLARLITGERQVTNYLHLGEHLHREAVRTHAGPGQLLRWLEHSIANPVRRLDDETQLRLETDVAAVQLCTIHKSKGLEYPIVICPTLWYVSGDDSKSFVLARFDEHGQPLEVPEIDVGSGQIKQRKNRDVDEESAEDRRLLYVALTRGKHQCRVYWTASKKAELSALGQIMLGAVDGKETDGELEAILQRWCDGLIDGGVVLRTPQQVEAISDPGFYQPGVMAPPHLKSRPIRRPDISGLAQTSFTALASAVKADVVYEAADRDENAQSGKPDSGDADGGVSEPIPLADMPGGRKIGDLVHRVFEGLLGGRGICGVDPKQLFEQVRDQLDIHMPRVHLDLQWREPLAQAMANCLAESLVFDGTECRLIDVEPSQIASEMHYVLRAGSQGKPMKPGDFCKSLALSSRPLVQTYAKRVKGIADQELRGFLEGFIDLVFAYEGKWYLLDYKTNKLGRKPEDYDTAVIESAMSEHHYVLQYHLYTVALDQMLRQRVPGYSYECDFGGNVYLFVRGFDPQVGIGRGVYFDRPDQAVIASLAAVVYGEEPG